MTDELLLQKLALLADWQYLCHDDFDEEEDMDEDQYWDYLNKQTPEYIQQMIADDFDGTSLEDVIRNRGSYLSQKYHQMIPNQ